MLKYLISLLIYYLRWQDISVPYVVHSLIQQRPPLMPMKASRARRFLQQGKAKVVHNDLGLFQIQLLQQPRETKTQDISLGIDPGKLYSGMGVVSQKNTLFRAHLQLPLQSVTKKNDH